MAKGPDAFRTISEAADEVGVPAHVLRFWESRFSFIRPMKRAGGRRFYRPQDVLVLSAIKSLLHDQGHAIKAVQKLHREHGLKFLMAGSVTELSVASSEMPVTTSTNKGPDAASRLRLTEALADLIATKGRLDGLLGTRPV